MKLKKLHNIVNHGCLISNCHGYGKVIGELNNELFTTYQNCEVVKICSETYKYYYGLEIWIEVTPQLQNNLCKRCKLDNCYKNPMYKEYTPY